MTADKEVRALLKMKRWSAYRLAKEAGVPSSTVTRILSGEMDPKHSTMEKLRKAAG